MKFQHKGKAFHEIQIIFMIETFTKLQMEVNLLKLIKDCISSP